MRCGEGDQIHPPKSKHSISFPVPPGRISRLTQTQSQSIPVPAASPPFQAMGLLRRRTPASSAASADNTPTEHLSLEPPPFSLPPGPHPFLKAQLSPHLLHNPSGLFSPGQHMMLGRVLDGGPAITGGMAGFFLQAASFSLPTHGGRLITGASLVYLPVTGAWGPTHSRCKQMPTEQEVWMGHGMAKEIGWQRNRSCRVRKVKKS